MKKTSAIILILIIVLGLAGAVYWYYKNMPIKSPEPSITVIAPNGGEILKEDSTYTIKWNTRNIPAANKISITIRRVPPPALPEEGQEFDPIIFIGLENTGSVDWKVSEMYPGGNYILGITSYASIPIINPITDESDAVFRIVKNVTWQTYSNEKLGYSIDYPSNWIFREFPDTQTGAGLRPLASSDEVASECINIDARGTEGNEYNTPFADYVKKAAIVEIQGYEKLNSIESITANDGVIGYETIWDYKDINNQEKVSLPITYFENKKIVQIGTSQIKFKTVQVILNSEECAGVYNQMLPTFKLLK